MQMAAVGRAVCVVGWWCCCKTRILVWPGLVCCVQLDASYGDIAGVRVFAGLVGKPSSSSGLAVWLSSGSGSSFNTTGVLCAAGLRIVPEAFATVVCPPLSNARYVTVVRTDPSTADTLVVHELQVTRTSESLGSSKQGHPCQRRSSEMKLVFLWHEVSPRRRTLASILACS